MVAEILSVGEGFLREKSQNVITINKQIIRILDDMRDTMRANAMEGISAPQIGVLLRVIVIDCGEGIYEMINPVIVSSEGQMEVTEGCKSVSKFNGLLHRADVIECEFYDRTGQLLHLEAKGKFSAAIQHEIDHLDGILFVDKALSVWSSEKEAI